MRHKASLTSPLPSQSMILKSTHNKIQLIDIAAKGVRTIPQIFHPEPVPHQFPLGQLPPVNSLQDNLPGYNSLPDNSPLDDSLSGYSPRYNFLPVFSPPEISSLTIPSLKISSPTISSTTISSRIIPSQNNSYPDNSLPK